MVWWMYAFLDSQQIYETASSSQTGSKSESIPIDAYVKIPNITEARKMFKPSLNTLKLRTCVLWLTRPNKVLLDQEKNQDSSEQNTKNEISQRTLQNNGWCHGDHICLLYSVWAAVFIWGQCILSLHFNSIDIGPNDNRSFIL